jgi:pyruvate/2-oxoglutarate dehydrogenase complex dihydrolipoamide dehydrogenase (E3) component
MGLQSHRGQRAKKKFEIYVDTPGKPGTVTTGVITGAVGQNMSIEGEGALSNGTCAVVGCIPQTSMLAGTVRFTTVPITKGASFKAESGNKY